MESRSHFNAIQADLAWMTVLCKKSPKPGKKFGTRWRTGEF
jgi:hypothetical protein